MSNPFKSIRKSLLNGKSEEIYTTPLNYSAVIFGLKIVNTSALNLNIDVKVNDIYLYKRILIPSNIYTYESTGTANYIVDPILEMKSKEVLNALDVVNIKATLEDTVIGEIGAFPWFTITQGDLDRRTVDVNLSILEIPST